jgi:glycosyl transferase family 87
VPSPGLPSLASEHRYRAAWRIAAAVLLLASVARFALEVRLVLEYCCYDFGPAFKRVVGFVTQGHALYPIELESYAPGVGDFKYPPLYALGLWLGVVAGLREVPSVPYLALQVALYLASVAVLVVAFGLQRRRGLALLFVVVALNFGPAFETLLRLQIEMPVLFCLSSAALCLQRGRSALAGWMVAAATMLKLYPALAILAFVPEGRRTLAGFGAGIVTVMLVSLTVLGPSECEHFFLRALPLMSRELPIETYHAENASVARWLMAQLGQSAETARLWGRAVAACLVAASLATLRFRRQARPAGGTELALLVPVMLLALPNSWANYQVLLLIPMAAMLGSACRSSAGHRLLQGGAVVLACLWLAYHIDTNHYPLWLHLPAALSVALHDNRVAVTLAMWAGVLWIGAGEAAPS